MQIYGKSVKYQWDTLVILGMEQILGDNLHPDGMYLENKE